MLKYPPVLPMVNALFTLTSISTRNCWKLSSSKFLPFFGFSSDFNQLANPQETDYAQSTNQRAPFECVDVTKHFLSNFFFARFFFSNFRRGGNQIREPHQERKSLENWTAKTYQEKITRRHYFENWLKKVTQNFLVCDFWFRGFWPWPRPVPTILKSWFWPQPTSTKQLPTINICSLNFVSLPVFSREKFGV